MNYTLVAPSISRNDLIMDVFICIKSFVTNKGLPLDLLELRNHCPVSRIQQLR